MSVKDYIYKIKEKIKAFRADQISEAKTKEWLIKPLFEELGWDFRDSDQIIPEDKDLAGKKPDYGFYHNQKVKFYVEAKAINTNIDDAKILAEKIGYCYNNNVPLLVITNGIEYRIYCTNLKGANIDKLLFQFSLLDDKPDENINKLSKEAVEKDELLKYANEVYLYSNIKTAIEELLQKPSRRLIEIINEQVKASLGHSFGEGEVRDALSHITLEISEEDPYGNQKDNLTSSKKDDGQDQAKWKVSDQFQKGKWKSSYELYEKLKKHLLKNEIKFVENPTKMYIGMINNEKNYFQVHGQSLGLKIWINIDFTSLSEQEKLKARDVSNIGHWGMGNTECTLRNENDFEWFMSIIKKAYEKTK